MEEKSRVITLRYESRRLDSTQGDQSGCTVMLSSVLSSKLVSKQGSFYD
jgi:hypothetical protein